MRGVCGYCNSIKARNDYRAISCSSRIAKERRFPKRIVAEVIAEKEGTPMKRVSILPLPEPGHFMPTFRAARSLVDAGHEVTYFSLPEFSDYVGQQGFRFTQIMSRFVRDHEKQPAFAVQNPGDQVIKRLFLEALRIKVGKEDLISLLAPDPGLMKASLLLCDIEMYRYLGAGLANLCDGNIVLFSTSLPTSQDQAVPELVFCPHHLEIAETLMPSEHRLYVEPSVFRSRSEEVFPWAKLNPQKDLVYCSLGTQSMMYRGAASTLQSLIQGFAGMNGFQLVVVTGSLPFDSADSLPENVIVVRSAPQLQMLERAKLFISHGGLGGIKEAILASVPMIVVPFVADQPANALRLEVHGLGKSVPNDICDPAALMEIVCSVVEDTRFYTRLSEMSAIFWDMEHVAPGAAYLSDRVVHC
jgi:UDP:flavonoid glycosyltransferase YjiC (YdhE family)